MKFEISRDGEVEKRVVKESPRRWNPHGGASRTVSWEEIRSSDNVVARNVEALAMFLGYRYPGHGHDYGAAQREAADVGGS